MMRSRGVPPEVAAAVAAALAVYLEGDLGRYRILIRGPFPELREEPTWAQVARAQHVIRRPTVAAPQREGCR